MVGVQPGTTVLAIATMPLRHSLLQSSSIRPANPNSPPRERIHENQAYEEKTLQFTFANRPSVRAKKEILMTLMTCPFNYTVSAICYMLGIWMLGLLPQSSEQRQPEKEEVC